MSVAAAAWGMSRNMPHEVYIANYIKQLVDTGLGGLQVIYKSEEEKQTTDNKQEVKKKEEKKKKTPSLTTIVTISEQKEEDEEKLTEK